MGFSKQKAWYALFKYRCSDLPFYFYSYVICICRSRALATSKVRLLLKRVNNWKLIIIITITIDTKSSIVNVAAGALNPLLIRYAWLNLYLEENGFLCVTIPEFLKLVEYLTWQLANFLWFSVDLIWRILKKFAN